MVAGAAPRAAQRFGGIGARREPRRRGAEDDSGKQGQAEGERQHHERRHRADGEEVRAMEGEAQKQARGGHGHQESRQAASDRE